MHWCCSLVTKYSSNCRAPPPPPAGQLQVVDTETCSQVLSLTNLGSINSVGVAGGGGVTAIAVASYHAFHPLGVRAEVTQSDILMLVAGGEGEKEEGWGRSYLCLPRGQDSFKVNMTLESYWLDIAFLYSFSVGLWNAGGGLRQQMFCLVQFVT